MCAWTQPYESPGETSPLERRALDDPFYNNDFPVPPGTPGNPSNPPYRHGHSHNPPNNTKTVTKPKPAPPDWDKIIRARVNQKPINPRPSGQDTNAPGWTPQPGSKIGDTLTGDAPINTDTVAVANPNGDSGPFNPGAQPGSPGVGTPAPLPPAQGQLDDASCIGGLQQSDGTTSSMICEGTGNSGDLAQTGGSSFRRPRGDIDFETGWAEHAYDQIRADPQLDAVAGTASSRGFTSADIEQIYNHLFLQEHQLDAGFMCFDANPRIALAWQRLQSGDPHSSDFQLLSHELYESSWMLDTGSQLYVEAHQAAIDAGFTWDEFAPEADGISFP